MTGLTSNPTIFDHAIRNSHDYDAAIREKTATGLSGEAALLRARSRGPDAGPPISSAPIHEATNGVDGWVSLEVSPTLAYDTASTVAAAKRPTRAPAAPNLFIKIPGTARKASRRSRKRSSPACPMNVTLLFSREHYVAAAEAYIRGIERRVAAGLQPASCGSVASVFISRWDVAVVGEGAPPELRGRLGIAIAKRTYKAYRDLLASDRWLRLAERRRALAAAPVGEHGHEGSDRRRTCST